MAGLNLSLFDDILKNVYLGPIREQIRTLTVLLSRIQRNSDNIDAEGRKAIFPVLAGYSQAIGARGDDEDLPTAAAAKYKKTEVSIKHNYGSIRITGPTMRSSQTNKGAFGRAVDLEVKNMLIGFKLDINRQLVSDGTGVLCEVNGAPAGQVITLHYGDPSASSYWCGEQYIQEGMYIDTYTPGGTIHDSGLLVSSIDTTNHTITIDAATTVTNTVDGDYIYRKGSRAKEIMGLRGIVDDGTLVSTLQGVDRTAAGNSWWQAKRFENSGTLRNLSLKLMQQPYSQCEKQAGAPDCLYTDFDLRDAYVALLVGEKRYVNTLTLDGGFTAVEFNGKPLIPDADAYPNLIFYLNESMLHISEQSDFDWMDEDGAILARVQGSGTTRDAYIASMYWDSEFGTFRDNSHSILMDVKAA